MRDFGRSWRDGRAFVAVVHCIEPSAIDVPATERMPTRDRLETAFKVTNCRPYQQRVNIQNQAYMISVFALLCSCGEPINRLRSISSVTFLTHFTKMSRLILSAFEHTT